MKNSDYHESVLVDEVIDGLHVKRECKYIDATLGSAGHSLAIVKKGGMVLGIEADSEMLKLSKTRFEEEKILKANYKFVKGNFENIDKVATKNGFTDVSGIIFDLGVSNIHLKDQIRGFSFENVSAELDMRLDREGAGVKASDLLTALREDQLRELFEVTLNPGAAMWLSRKIVKFREIRPIVTVGNFIEACRGLKTEKRDLNPATLPFLALRIAVNSELTNLRDALPKAFELISSGGRLLVISFHSKEDGLVKEYFKRLVADSKAIAITYKPLKASENEVFENRKSRSAKLRIVEKS